MPYDSLRSRISNAKSFAREARRRSRKIRYALRNSREMSMTLCTPCRKLLLQIFSAGSVIVKVVPFPSSLSTAISP